MAAVKNNNEIDVLFVGKCRFQTAANQNNVFFACLDFVLIIDFRARFDSKIKCCRAVFGFKKKDKDKVKVSYFFGYFSRRRNNLFKVSFFYSNLRG